jgi:hypothetical protein
VTKKAFALPEADDLFRIEDVERVQRPLEAAHGGERGLAEFGFCSRYCRRD